MDFVHALLREYKLNYECCSGAKLLAPLGRAWTMQNEKKIFFAKFRALFPEVLTFKSGKAAKIDKLVYFGRATNMYKAQNTMEVQCCAKNIENNDKFYRKVVFIMYTEIVNLGLKAEKQHRN